MLESTAQAMFKFTGYVMSFAPIGVFAAIAATVGGKGLAILFTLGKLIALMYLGLAIFVLIVVGGVSYLIRVPFFTFVKAIREPFLIAFTTASSEAALPKALEVMERFGVPKNIVGFVLPTGYSFNLDGTTLYLSLASVFVAQLGRRAMLTFGQQLVMMLTLMLTSKGVAGVPRAALVVLTATLTQFGLPLEGAAILLGIDQIMDMGRTAVNVMGNCIATAVVARWEGVFDDARCRRSSSRKRPSPNRLMRVAVIGARGQLGAAIVHECRDVHEIAAFSRADLDIDRRCARSRRRWRGARPDAIVNCAALQRRRRRRRSPDRRAERQRLRRPRAGARGAAARRDARALQHATSSSTARATAAVHRRRYAQPAQRLCGVEAARRMVCAGCAARLRASRREPVRTGAGGGPPKGSIASITNTLVGGGTPTVFEDRTVSPTYVLDAARATRQLLELQAPTGLYHCVNSGACTWVELSRGARAAAGRRAASETGAHGGRAAARRASSVLRPGQQQAASARHRDAVVAGRAQSVRQLDPVNGARSRTQRPQSSRSQTNLCGLRALGVLDAGR